MDCYLKDVFDKFEQIKNTSARTGKESLLRQYENDEMFKMTLKFLLDPYIVTNVGAARLKKFSSPSIELNGFKEYIEFLINKADGKLVEQTSFHYYRLYRRVFEVKKRLKSKAFWLFAIEKK